MAERYEMRFSGSGGQGIILISVILAEAAVIAGKHAVQSQSYGPEARGGLCKAETILSNGTIWFSKVTRPNFLFALTQASLNKYSADLAEDWVLLTDTSLEVPAGLDSSRVIKLPVLDTAREKVGKLMTANIVAVGAINRLLGLVDDNSLNEAVLKHIPAGTEEINNKALAEGIALVSDKQAAKFRQATV